MVDYLTVVGKLVQCTQGHTFKIMTNDIIVTCPTCGEKVAFSNFGTIGGKFH